MFLNFFFANYHFLLFKLRRWYILYFIILLSLRMFYLWLFLIYWAFCLRRDINLLGINWLISGINIINLFLNIVSLFVVFLINIIYFILAYKLSKFMSVYYLMINVNFILNCFHILVLFWGVISLIYRSWIVPKNISLLNFLILYFTKKGINFWLNFLLNLHLIFWNY